MPPIRAHDAFYPHAHIRDLKKAAKRGKILVITLVVSAGLTVLIANALIRGDKSEADDGAGGNLNPTQLRTCVIAAAMAGTRGLFHGEQEAMNMAFSEYAKQRDIEWIQEPGAVLVPEETYTMGNDRLSVSISREEMKVEVNAICGKMRATASADAKKGSVQSLVSMVK